MSTTSATRSDHPPAVRASHAEREATVESLHRALGEGRLDLEETDHRVAAAYAAQYREDLPGLLADLPYDAPVPASEPTASARYGAPSWTEMWLHLVWRVRITVWGDRAGGIPTAAQLRAAGLLAGLALVWTVLCAVLAAIMVAS